MAALYHSLFTEKGLELLRESIQNGTKLGITHMSFGDGGGSLPVPDASFNQMVNEVYRVALNRLAPSKDNPNWLEADGVIPSAIGGFNIREVGLWAGDVMVAYANYPPTYKPSGDQGTAQIKTIRIVLQIDNTANFELKIDASIVMATLAVVDEKIAQKDVNSINDLKLLNPNYDGEIYYLKGFYPNNSDGEGRFRWVEQSTKTEVPGIIIKLNSKDIGRFERIFDTHLVNVLHCGAIRDGVTETHTQIKTALNYAIQNNMPCYAPKGTYILGGRVDPTVNTSNTNTLFLGDGRGLTTLKDKDGLTAQLGRYNMSIYLNTPDGITTNSVIVGKMTIDKNGKTSPASSTYPYEFEQAHGLAIASGWNNSKIKFVRVFDFEVKDKIGAGVCLTQGYIDIARIENIIGTDYQHIGGQRGDFEFQAVVTDLEVTGSQGLYTQCEPNVPQPPNGAKCKASFNGCTYNIAEFTAFINSPESQAIEFNNFDSPQIMTLRWCKANGSNVRFNIGSGNTEYWDKLAEGSVFDESCTMVVSTNVANNTTNPFYLREGFFKFKGKIVPDKNFLENTTGFAVKSQLVYNATTKHLLDLDGAIFDPRFERSIDCYANGNYKIRRCTLAARSGLSAIQVGGYGNYYSNVELENNDLTNIVGPFINFIASNTLWSLNFKGVHDSSKLNFTSNQLANTEQCVKCEGAFTSNTIPDKGLVGIRAKINKPAFGTGAEFICTVSSTPNSSAVYQLLHQAGVKLDSTPNRPTGLTAASRGLTYLDTTLSPEGKLITYNGSKWVDHTGAVV